MQLIVYKKLLTGFGFKSKKLRKRLTFSIKDSNDNDKRYNSEDTGELQYEMTLSQMSVYNPDVSCLSFNKKYNIDKGTTYVNCPYTSKRHALLHQSVVCIAVSHKSISLHKTCS